MTIDLKQALEKVHGLRVLTVGGTKSPHKYLFLLALARLYERNPQRKNAFPLNEELEHEFMVVSAEFCSDAGNVLIEFPYNHLTGDDVWQLTLRQGMEQQFREYETQHHRRLTHKRLIETVEYGSMSSVFDRCFRKSMERTALAEVLRDKLADLKIDRNDRASLSIRETGGVMTMNLSNKQIVNTKPGFASLSLSALDGSPGNPFVGYLNSLLRLSAGNENALAEFQSCSPFFSLIHVAHPITQAILEELQNPNGRQLILTGHAGDGKSTIALDVYRQLTNRKIGEPLSKLPLPREDLPSGVSILKDLSERRKTQDETLMREILEAKRRFMIVSNTGALLDFFQKQEAVHGVSQVQMESDVLSAIGADGGQYELTVGATRFLVVNLARIDNLALARQIFDRMINPARWTVCEGQPCRASCPICINLDLINHCREKVLDRLFLAYRRMYEYGTRLTLRQITEHLAYLITSGLEEADIAEMRARRLSPLKAEFMFFNRFFGDNGKTDHAAALQMRAVQEVRRQGFGERHCPTWERKLWLKLREGNFRLGVEDCEQEFELLREHGSGPGNDSRPGLSPDQAREQVRRMLYFLYDFDKDNQSFLRQFLNSPTILRWQEWQQEGARLEMTEKNVLEQRIYHVLQEHFTGVRLPEGSKSHDRRLYITLSRGKSDIRQSAQVVVAQVDWSNETSLELASCTNTAGGRRTDLELQGRGRIKNAKLVLTLPFLDYVLMRHFGELGETLQAAYVERLERFKAQIQDLAMESSAQVMLVRLKTDHTFRRQQYTICDGKLEVNDVL
jgi:hypothetical protein